MYTHMRTYTHHSHARTRAHTHTHTHTHTQHTHTHTQHTTHIHATHTTHRETEISLCHFPSQPLLAVATAWVLFSCQHPTPPMRSCGHQQSDRHSCIHRQSQGGRPYTTTKALRRLVQTVATHCQLLDLISQGEHWWIS